MHLQPVFSLAALSISHHQNLKSLLKKSVRCTAEEEDAGGEAGAAGGSRSGSWQAQLTLGFLWVGCSWVKRQLQDQGASSLPVQNWSQKTSRNPTGFLLCKIYCRKKYIKALRFSKSRQVSPVCGLSAPSAFDFKTPLLLAGL